MRRICVPNTILIIQFVIMVLATNLYAERMVEDFDFDWRFGKGESSSLEPVTITLNVR